MLRFSWHIIFGFYNNEICPWLTKSLVSWVHFSLCVFLTKFLCIPSKLSLYFIGKPFNALTLINNAVSNVICCLVFGDRSEYTDKQHQAVLQHFSDLVSLQGSVWVQVSHLCKQVKFLFFLIRLYLARHCKSMLCFNTTQQNASVSSLSLRWSGVCLHTL